MGVAGLDLLREGVDVAEAALQGAAGEDRVDAGGLVGPVGDRDGVGDGLARQFDLLPNKTTSGIIGVEARLRTASMATLMPRLKRSLRRHGTLSDRIPFGFPCRFPAEALGREMPFPAARVGNCP
jgi:hypothetical protein